MVKADFMRERFATDSGPVCKKCNQELWIYLVDRNHVLGQCASCHEVERFNLLVNISIHDLTIYQIKEAHQSTRLLTEQANRNTLHME